MRKGNTYALTKGIVNYLLFKPDVECTEISVADLELPFCCSCHACFAKGEEHCPHYAVMHGVQSALMECDGVILSGTTYMWALNAAMKNLLDHLAYGFHRPALFGKKGMVIATSAGNGEKSVAKYIKTALGQWGINGAIVVTQNTKEQQLLSSDKIAAKLDCAAERFYQLIASKRFIAPSLKSIAVHNAFRAMSLSDFAENERDMQYWRQDGFYNRAYPVKAGPKYGVGALMYGAAKYSAKMLGRIYTKRLNTRP
jgi:multimeric flavodoxin WrbA